MSQNYQGPLGFEQPTPKKKRTGLWIALGVALLLVLLLVGGCLAIGGAAVKGVDQAIASQEAKSTPKTVQIGEAFTVGSHEVQNNWKIKSDELGNFTVVAKVKNTSQNTSSALVDFRLMKGDEVIATTTCTTTDLEPNQTQALDCLGADKFTKKYDLVQAQTSF